MLHHLLLLTILNFSRGFTLDATAHYDVEVPLPADSVRSLVGRISTLETMMPGVVDITAQIGGGFLYRTEREIPFSGKMQTDFRIVSIAGEDGSVTYRTPGTEAENWMSFRLAPAATAGGTTRLFLRLRVRLVRSQGTDIHLLAPLLGEGFLSKSMEDDLSAMLQVFADRLVQRHTSVHTARN